jgi:hypothetical protein
VRALGRIALVLVAVALLALGAAAWLLPRWLEGDAFRELLVGAARDATGRDVAWDDLSLALFPPRLVATQLRVGEAVAPLVVAERADLRIAVAPLLARGALRLAGTGASPGVVQRTASPRSRSATRRARPRLPPQRHLRRPRRLPRPRRARSPLLPAAAPRCASRCGASRCIARASSGTTAPRRRPCR